jgi:hypothetical protein
MQTDTLTRAAALLDDLASGTLTDGEFYVAMIEAGPLASDLVIPAIIDGTCYGENTDYAMLAAECLKDICLDGKNFDRALSEAKHYSDVLYMIADV